MFNWIDVNKELPNSDDIVFIKTSEGRIHSAVCWIEFLEENKTERTWVTSLGFRDIDDYLYRKEEITHWSYIGEVK